MGQIILFQRAEGLAILLGSSIGYAIAGRSWLMFFILLLAPDVFMAGYLINKKIGAYIYNLGHSLITPITLGVIGHLAEAGLIIALSLIWLAHIGMDRAFGYGLKLETGFRKTHLGEIGNK